MSARGRCLPREVSAHGGVCQRGPSAQGGVHHLLVNRMTDGQA